MKKELKFFNNNFQYEIEKNLKFKLTYDQKKCLIDINSDLKNKEKMFRLLQGDVGSGKTIVALISALNVVESGYQVAVMAPTDILSKQHFNLARNIYPKNINISLLSGKTTLKDKKNIKKKI